VSLRSLITKQKSFPNARASSLKMKAGAFRCAICAETCVQPTTAACLSRKCIVYCRSTLNKCGKNGRIIRPVADTFCLTCLSKWIRGCNDRRLNCCKNNDSRWQKAAPSTPVYVAVSMLVGCAGHSRTLSISMRTVLGPQRIRTRLFRAVS
jgi:hypothetical protein